MEFSKEPEVKKEAKRPMKAYEALVKVKNNPAYKSIKLLIASRDLKTAKKTLNELIKDLNNAIPENEWEIKSINKTKHDVVLIAI